MASQVILAFDTSSAACSLALQTSGGVTSIHEIMPLQQARQLLPMIQELLDGHSLTLQQVDVIAYGCGPGSFTGTRIACSVAQGLGFAAKCRLLPISSLASIAQSAYKARHWEQLIVAVDARVGEVYCAPYRLGQEGCVELIGAEWTGNPADIMLPIDLYTGWFGAGDGWETYGEVLSNRLRVKPHQMNNKQLPTAEAVLELANVALKNGAEGISPSCAIPVYLR